MVCMLRYERSLPLLPPSDDFDFLSKSISEKRQVHARSCPVLYIIFLSKTCGISTWSRWYVASVLSTTVISIFVRSVI